MWFLTHLAIGATALAMLFCDSTAAVPIDGPVSSQLLPDDGKTVARRRGRRKKKRKTRPRPEPEPATPSDSPAAAPAAAPVGSGGRLSGTTRIEFDAQMIKGQTTKAGEVQILERKDSELKSMVKRRTSFREEIIHTVFPEK